MENETETNTFRNGEIYGIRNVLKRIEKMIAAKETFVRPHLKQILYDLIREINTFPTVEEGGKFVIDGETKLVAFTYKKENEV